MLSKTALLGRTALLAFTLLAPAAADVTDKEARAIHDSILVFDPHADVPSPASAAGGRTIDAGTQVDIAKLRAGGVDAVALSVFVEQSVRTPEAYAAARKQADAKLAAIQEIVRRRPQEVVLVRSAREVEAAAAAGKTAVLVSLLNAYALGADPEELKAFHGAGVRIFGLVHAGNNDFADSSRPHARDIPDELGGLSDKGRRAIALANDLGVLVDVSQLTREGLLQAVELSRAPVIASHSGVAGVVASPRNLTDAELDAIKAKGGVVAIVAFSSYLKAQTPEQQEKVRAIRAKYGAVNGYEGLSAAQRAALAAETRAVQTRATVVDLVSSIDYAVKRIGIEHVAISTDFNHGGGVEGFDDASEAPNVTLALLEQGYSKDDVAKLWGGNVLRVLRAAEAGALPHD
jgi:membrane dipeptidase